jgi:RHS repeat-associated protein
VERGRPFPLSNNFRFPGQYYDSETGLHYNYHRYYNPRTGRYLEKDPIGMKGGINLYVYAENNSVRFSDNEGLKVQICVRPLKNAFILNHKYIAVNGTSYGFYDDSKVHKDDPLDQPGWGTHCVTISDSDCKDKCVLDAIKSYTPPPYNLNNNNCFHWADKILSKCGL